MSSQITLRKLTRADYETLPPGGPRFLLIDGELHMAPSPDRFHQDRKRIIQLHGVAGAPDLAVEVISPNFIEAAD